MNGSNMSMSTLDSFISIHHIKYNKIDVSIQYNLLVFSNTPFRHQLFLLSLNCPLLQLYAYTRIGGNNILCNLTRLTTCLGQWLARLTAIQKVPGSIPGYTLEIFLEVQGLERGPPSLVTTIGQLLDMRSSEIRLRKLKLRLRDNALLTIRLPSGSYHFSRSWPFGAVAPRIYLLIYY